MLFAHRGASAERPENTLPAFALALELGADALEIDVHLTRDGHVVVLHDADLLRTAGVPVPVSALTLAQLQQLDVGFYFRDAHGRRPFEGARVPTLSRVLAEFPGVLLSVDIKPQHAAACAAVIDVVRAARAQAHVRLASFSERNLQRVRAARYEGELAYGPLGVALLAGHAWRALAPLHQACAAAQVPVRMGAVPLDSAAFVSAVHRSGAQLIYWAINDPREAARLLALGADGLITDDVRAIAPVIEAAKAAPRR